jgi:hypothetical protein
MNLFWLCSLIRIKVGVVDADLSNPRFFGRALSIATEQSMMQSCSESNRKRFPCLADMGFGRMPLSLLP